MKKSAKGAPRKSIFHNRLCFLLAGTSLHLARFDELKRDDRYAVSMETTQNHLLSSHAVNRFLQNISIVRVWFSRKALRRLSVWRPSVEQPESIILGIDTMVLNNDEANKRVVVEPS